MTKIITIIKISSSELRRDIKEKLESAKPFSQEEILNFIKEKCEQEALNDVFVEINAQSDGYYQDYQRFGLLLDSQFEIAEKYNL